MSEPQCLYPHNGAPLPTFSLLPGTVTQVNELTLQSEPSWPRLVLLVRAGCASGVGGMCFSTAPIQAIPAARQLRSASLMAQSLGSFESPRCCCSPKRKLRLPRLPQHHFLISVSCCALQGLGRVCDLQSPHPPAAGALATVHSCPCQPPLTPSSHHIRDSDPSSAFVLSFYSLRLAPGERRYLWVLVPDSPHPNPCSEFRQGTLF